MTPGQTSAADETADVAQKLQGLRDLLREMDSVLVCFSGGIDSAFLLAVATEVLAERALGMTAISPSLPEIEKDAALKIARELGARHRYVDSNEMARPGYRNNGADRCFHCKTELYSIAEQKKQEWGLSWVANGTNTDDFGDYRPGLQAAEQAGVRSPLAEVGMNKSDVRKAARVIGMSIWNKPAAACLSSRIPYGISVTRERLRQVEHVETALRAMGFANARVRWHEAIARVEVLEEDLARIVEKDCREKLLEAAKESGFKYTTVDLAGYRTGSLNALLEGRSLKVV